MRSGLAIEMRIWSKLCGPETCPKMFINSFIEDPSLWVVMPAKAGDQETDTVARPWTPAIAGLDARTPTPEMAGRARPRSSAEGGASRLQDQ